jgi:hypothetical protein
MPSTCPLRPSPAARWFLSKTSFSRELVACSIAGARESSVPKTPAAAMPQAPGMLVATPGGGDLSHLAGLEREIVEHGWQAAARVSAISDLETLQRLHEMVRLPRLRPLSESALRARCRPDTRPGERRSSASTVLPRSASSGCCKTAGRRALRARPRQRTAPARRCGRTRRRPLLALLLLALLLLALPLLALPLLALPLPPPAPGSSSLLRARGRTRLPRAPRPQIRRRRRAPSQRPCSPGIPRSWPGSRPSAFRARR